MEVTIESLHDARWRTDGNGMCGHVVKNDGVCSDYCPLAD
jgi:hypothetical protein